MPLTAHGEQSALRSHRTPNTAASTAPLPASVTIMIRPSCGVGCESSRCDLGQMGTEIFFGKPEIRLDSRANHHTAASGCSPDGAKRNPGSAARESRIARSLSSGAHSRDPLAPSGLRRLPTSLRAQRSNPSPQERLDCFVACAPRNDEGASRSFPDFAEFIIGRAFARPVGSIRATLARNDGVKR